jgi:hypothetical protein
MGSSSLPVFSNCPNFTTLNIGNSVQHIPDNAFYGCSGLTSVNFNAINCTYMGSSSYPVFSSCPNFTTLNIGNSVLSIPDNAFYGCSALTTVTNPITTPIAINANVFTGVYPCTLKVVTTSVSAYLNASYGWTNFTIVGKDYQVSVTANDIQFGRVSTVGGLYNTGEQVTAVALSNTNYHFENWTSADTLISTSYSFTFTVTRDTNIVANFVPNTFIVGLSVNNALYGSVSGSGGYPYMGAATVTAIANTGYVFTHWTSAGNLISNDNPFTFTVLNNINLLANFELDTFTVSATANNALCGSVGGGGDYPYMEQATVTATANAHYHFANWTSKGIVLSTVTSFTFTVMGDTNIVANFVPDTFAVSVSANNTLYGSASGDGDYPYMGEAILTATPQHGYRFANWTSNGIVCSATNPFTFTITRDTNMIATFVLDTFAVSATVNNVLYGNISGSGTYPYMEPAILTATANANYHFANWTSNGIVLSTVSPFTFTVMGDTNIVANFVPDTFAVSVSANNALYGGVSGGGGYPYMGEAILTATPQYGYRFANWTRNGIVCSAANPFTFTVTRDTNMIATFVLDSFAVAVTTNNVLYGSVSGSGTYPYMEPAILTATANANYHFANWTSAGVLISIANPFACTVRSDTNLVANFVPDTFTVSVLANNALYGGVSGGGGYPYMGQTILTATPQYGYRFANWTSNGIVCSVANPFTFTVTRDTNMIATFVLDSFAVAVTANNTLYGNVSGSNNYAYTTQAILTATPQYGYVFANWTSNGTVFSAANPFSFTVTSNMTIVANFVPNSFAVSVSANNALYGGVSGSNSYPYPTQATLTATPQYGYRFVNWTSNSIVLSTTNSFTFTVTRDTNIVANFVPDTFTVTANNTLYGNVSGSADYPYLEQASLTATPQYGYVFVNWTSNGIVLSTANPFTFMVTMDTNIIANFVSDTVTVTVTANNELYGNVSGGDAYSYTAQASLTATPTYGYVFANWTSNGIVLSTINPFMFTVTMDTNIVANFVPDTFTVSVSANYVLYGSVSGEAKYAYTMQATVTATANTGYTFENWTSKGVVLSTDNPFTFTVTSDTTIVANFKSTIGISETTTLSSIVLYPNPVEDIVHIQSSAAIEQATIYDLSGRIVCQVQMTNDISVQDLARGVYVIKIETKKGIEVRKIVKE